MFDDYFEHARDLTRRGVPFATATVVRAEKPTSGKPGDRAIVTLDGVMSGWIGGSCAQPTVVREARQALADDQSRLIRLSTTPSEHSSREDPSREGIVERPMTCFSGGTLEIFIEPHAPRPRLLVVGHLPTAQALAHLGKAMSYHVIAVVPQGVTADDEGGDGAAAMAHADEVPTDFESIDERVTPLTFAVVASHGHYDEQALRAVLATTVPYVGLVASPKRGEVVVQVLREAGLDDTALQRLKAPAGLDIGARRGDEIALSIMAEVIEKRRAVERFAWGAETSEQASDDDPAAVSSCCGGSQAEQDEEPPEPVQAASGGCCGGS